MLLSIDAVNSFEDAIMFWNIEYGKPDFYSMPEDITEVMNLLLQYKDELKSLETEIIRRDGDLPHNKLNRAIVLHFIVKAAEQYLADLNTIVYDNVYEEELEKLDAIETVQHPWEKD